jgi:hypothetical protein
MKEVDSVLQFFEFRWWIVLFYFEDNSGVLAMEK